MNGSVTEGSGISNGNEEVLEGSDNIAKLESQELNRGFNRDQRQHKAPNMLIQGDLQLQMTEGDEL